MAQLNIISRLINAPDFTDPGNLLLSGASVGAPKTQPNSFPLDLPNVIDMDSEFDEPGVGNSSGDDAQAVTTFAYALMLPAPLALTQYEIGRDQILFVKKNPAGAASSDTRQNALSKQFRSLSALNYQLAGETGREEFGSQLSIKSFLKEWSFAGTQLHSMKDKINLNPQQMDMTLVIQGRTRMLNYWGITGEMVPEHCDLYLLFVRRKFKPKAVAGLLPITKRSKMTLENTSKWVAREESDEESEEDQPAPVGFTEEVDDSYHWQIEPWYSIDGSLPPRSLYITWDEKQQHKQLGNYLFVGKATVLLDARCEWTKIKTDLGHLARSACFPTSVDAELERTLGMLPLLEVQLLLH